MPRPKLKTWATWTCTLAAAAAVSLAVFSRFYSCGYLLLTNSGDTAWEASAWNGLITFEHRDGVLLSRVRDHPGFSMFASRRWFWGYSGEVRNTRAKWEWRAGLLLAPKPTGWEAGVSILYPIALSLTAAAMLWHNSRRRSRPGSCTSCGYDRAGLAATVQCPECGQPA